MAWLPFKLRTRSGLILFDAEATGESVGVQTIQGVLAEGRDAGGYPSGIVERLYLESCALNSPLNGNSQEIQHIFHPTADDSAATKLYVDTGLADKADAAATTAALATKADAAATATALATKATGGQAAIADLALGSTGVPAVDTVLGVAQAKVNAILADLRASGLVSP